MNYIQESERIKMWTKGVQVEEEALKQLHNVASLPFIHSHIAVMPDVHYGIGATIGSVIPTIGAIIPAAVGVDIGCGMMAVKTSLKAEDLPDSLAELRLQIEGAIPCGNGSHGNHQTFPKITLDSSEFHIRSCLNRQRIITENHEKSYFDGALKQLGTLGGGNHFIELCLDDEASVWLMLHSGSRGAGNAIGRYFIERAKEELLKRELGYNVPDKDLAFLKEGEPLFYDYIEAVKWAQNYASLNRSLMRDTVLNVMSRMFPEFYLIGQIVNCHHNYVNQEYHFGQDVLVTRKGAVSAKEGQLGIIPGSMGTKSYIVRGKGNADSFHSCSHGAGRAMSRSAAKKKFTLEDHIKATEGIECRKDLSVIDETPASYKDIDAVIAAQSDLIDVVYTLKQVLCVKG